MIVLDTHAFVWWRSGSSRLSSVALDAIEATGYVVLPDVVLLEIAMLAEAGCIKLDRSAGTWLQDAVADPSIEVMPIDPEIAQRAIGVRRILGGGDPVDAVIAATALRLNVPLVTRDARLSALRMIETVW